MKGYFISNEKAKELGLLDNSNLKKELQKVIFAITTTDIKEYQETFKLKKIDLSKDEIEKIANWFYKNYYYGFFESILE